MMLCFASQQRPVGSAAPVQLIELRAHDPHPVLVENLSTSAGEHPHDKLSARELQTLVMIASGKRLSDIANDLVLSPKTVSVYTRAAPEAAVGKQCRADNLRDFNGLVGC